MSKRNNTTQAMLDSQFIYMYVYVYVYEDSGHVWVKPIEATPYNYVRDIHMIKPIFRRKKFKEKM